jgi:hypothetical protein
MMSGNLELGHFPLFGCVSGARWYCGFLLGGLGGGTVMEDVFGMQG